MDRRTRTLHVPTTARVIPLQDTEVASTDDAEESHLPFKIHVDLLRLWNRHNPSNVLGGLPRWRLDEVGNRMTKFQAIARGYLVRTNPWIRELMLKEEPVSPEPIDYSARYMTVDRFRAECALVGRTEFDPTEFDNTHPAIVFIVNVQACALRYIIRKKVDTFWIHHVAASRIQAAWRGFKTRNFLVPAIIFRLLRRRAQRRLLECAPETNNDRMLQLEWRMNQETKSREAMEARFEEVVDEVRLLQGQADFMQKEIVLYKKKLETAETEIEQRKNLDEQVQKESRLRKSLETQLEEARTEILSLKDALEHQSLDLQSELEERLDETERLAEVTKQILQDQVKVLQQKAEKEAEARLELERRLEKVQTEKRISKSAEERGLREELVQDHSSGGMPARSSQENGTQPSSNKRAPIKVSVNGPPRSRSLSAKSNVPKVTSDQTKVITPNAPSSALVSRAIPKEDKRPVLGTAKATRTNVRSGKSTAVRGESKLSLPIKTL